jgi:hypothetical protein
VFGSSKPRTLPFSRDEYIIYTDELSSSRKPSIKCASFLAEIGVDDETTYCPNVRNVFAVSCASLVAICTIFLGSHFLGWPHPDRLALGNKKELKMDLSVCSDYSYMKICMCVAF